MTGFNHAAVGGLIATVLPLPIALPLAFASHFVLDALPHYGIPHHDRDKSRTWRAIGVIDFIAAWVIIGGLAAYWQHWEIFIAGLVAASPDFVWVARIFRTKSFNLSENQSKFNRWHARIQRFERPWGIYLEVPLAMGLFFFLFNGIAF